MDIVGMKDIASGKSAELSVAPSEVAVLAERPFVQHKADRMIVSVEHSKLLKARSLSNILNLIPGVNYEWRRWYYHYGQWHQNI